MIESEWLASDDPAAMLEHLHYLTYEEMDGVTTQNRQPPLISDRKLRLFAVACCRQVWNPCLQRAMEVAERYADGEATEEMARAYLREVVEDPGVDSVVWDAMCCMLSEASQAAKEVGQGPLSCPLATQAALLREIISPWLPPQDMAKAKAAQHVVALARSCYDSEAAHGPLADALEELGYALLAKHLREPMHVKGCFAIDLVLGKE